jgi:hypothetical protein
MNSVDFKINRVHPFDVSRPGGISRLGVIHFYLVSYSIKLAPSAAGGWADTPGPELV